MTPTPPESRPTSSSGSPLLIRDARPHDRDAIAAHNAAMGLETEGKTLDRETLAQGVAAALADPTKLRYWVAEHHGDVIGQAGVTLEWSDWRNGWIWWIQSVYVHPDHRRAGVFQRLLDAIRETARDQGNVVALRLYVEEANTRAQAAYHALGLHPAGYLVYEQPLS